MTHTVKLVKLNGRSDLVDEYKAEFVIEPSGGLIEEAAIFTGVTRLREHVTAFVGTDGSALVLLSADPEAYVRGMHLMRTKALGWKTLLKRGGPAELHMLPGSFDPNSDEIVLTEVPSLF